MFCNTSWSRNQEYGDRKGASYEIGRQAHQVLYVLLNTPS
jgi:hypothetical protein